MIDLSAPVLAPELAQSFTILRSTGQFLNGVWKSTEIKVNAYGVISVAKAKELQMIPEADVIHGAMVFHVEQPIYTTNQSGPEQGHSSDILIWRGKKFRVLQVAQYEDYNFWRAIATRLSAA